MRAQGGEQRPAGRRGQHHGHRTLPAEAGCQIAEGPVVKQVSSSDQQHPRTEGGDVGEVVGGQDDGRLAGEAAEELPEAELHGNVQADRGFVKEQDRWIMEERRG